MSEELQRDAEALARQAWGSSARVVDLSALAGDASSRRYYRLRLEATGPPTAVLMVQPGSGLAVSSEELAVFAEPLREMPFLNVQRYLRAVGIAVPEVFAAEPERGLVLLEDVGGVTLWDAARASAEDGAIGLYRSAIDELVALQLAGRDRPDRKCIAFRQRFDARLFLWELDHFLEYGLDGRSVTAGDRRAMREHFEALSAELGAEPAVLAHRDYHGWNLFVQAGKIRVIDFQDALLAPPAYDLASLLTDRSTPRLLKPARELDLVGYYCARLAERGGQRLDARELSRRYFRVVLQRALKVIGRFHYLEKVKGKRGYVAMLPDTIATVRRSLASLPELRELRSLLARSFPELT